MQYFIKTKLVKFIVDTIYIKDSQNADKFLIKQRFSIPAKWDFFDMSGNRILRIKKRAFRFFGRYDIINAEKKTLAIIKRKFSFFIPKYKITSKVDDKASYELAGDVLSWNFHIIKNDKNICDIKKQIIALTNSYQVDVHDENETLLCLSCVIALGKEHHKNKNR